MMMGLPAAGKSWIVNRDYNESHTVIDSDAIMATHPEYDPKNPANLYQWAAQKAAGQMETAIESGEGRWLYDSTGTNAERLVRYLNAAKERGMQTTLVYVTVSIETSLERNSKRERVVPEHIIHEKAQDIQTAYEIVRQYTDSERVVENE